MRKFLAVDVALLPSQTVMDELIGLIQYDPGSPILLNSHNCLPHVTLAMGVIDEDDIAGFKEALSGFDQEAKSLKLTAERTNTYVADNGKHLSEVSIKLTDELHDFRSQVVTALRPMFGNEEPTTDMFYSPPAVEKITTKWVLKFGEEFRPHITLGEGQVKALDRPMMFYPRKLALCQLGNYCTCRRVL